MTGKSGRYVVSMCLTLLVRPTGAFCICCVVSDITRSLTIAAERESNDGSVTMT